LTINQCCLTFAVLIQEVLMAFHLYQITKNPLILGLVGIMDFLPFLALSLWGGYIADRFNRQRILQISFSFAIPLSIALDQF
jgi:MFS family permease